MQGGTYRSEKGGRVEWYKLLALVIGWLLIFSLAKDVLHIREGFNRIKEANQRLEAEKSKNETLKNKLDLILTDEYKERIIREKLNMQKEGEVVVVMPKNQDRKEALEATDEAETKANWEKWWALIK